jgi:YesN/AraC family two-component response regulator
MNKKTILYIKNMVCERCIRVVRDELEKIGLHICHIELGKVELEQVNNYPSLEKIRRVLLENGFDLIEDKKAKMIEAIKNIVISLVHQDSEIQPLNMNYSDYLSEQLAVDYHYLSSLFSSVENITIEHYIILQKIERAKELLKYNEYTLSEIAYKLGYSSVQHLSNQFNKVTGMTASQFRNMTANLRKSLDKVY